jgi:hypothetical protein
MDFEKLIDRFNDGELEVEAYFGNFNNFLTLANKRGLISKFDINNDEIQNSLGYTITTEKNFMSSLLMN